MTINPIEQNSSVAAGLNAGGSLSYLGSPIDSPQTRRRPDPRPTKSGCYGWVKPWLFQTAQVVSSRILHIEYLNRSQAKT
jgi:hypothetical protein